jgi:LCP family protein required for cell wall assembly
VVSTTHAADVTTSTSPPRRRRSRARKALIALGVVVLLLVLAVAAYLVVLDRTLASNLHRDDSLMHGLTNRPEKPTSGAGADALNYLLIGSDGRFGSEASSTITGQRSDTIMVAHVTAKRDKVYLVAFPRDLYVDIPGHGKNKINAAFSFGGTPLLVETLEQLTSVRIDHVAVIDFQGFRDLTSLLGGVTVDNQHASSVGQYHWPQGPVTVQGEEALQYVRQRHGLPGGDLDRVERQQQVVKAILLKGLSKDTVTHPAKVVDLISVGASHLTVDGTLGQGELRGTALSMRGLRGGDIAFVQAPLTGFGRSPSGASIDVLDTARMTALSKALREDDVPGYLAENPARSR